MGNPTTTETDQEVTLILHSYGFTDLRGAALQTLQKMADGRAKLKR